MITIGTRIKYLRMKHGMTMKYLGQIIGFPPSSADVRIAQYEVLFQNIVMCSERGFSCNHCL